MSTARNSDANTPATTAHLDPEAALSRLVRPGAVRFASGGRTRRLQTGRGEGRGGWVETAVSAILQRQAAAAEGSNLLESLKVSCQDGHPGSPQAPHPRLCATGGTRGGPRCRLATPVRSSSPRARRSTPPSFWGRKSRWLRLAMPAAARQVGSRARGGRRGRGGTGMVCASVGRASQVSAVWW